MRPSSYGKTFDHMETLMSCKLGSMIYCTERSLLVELKQTGSNFD